MFVYLTLLLSALELQLPYNYMLCYCLKRSSLYFFLYLMGKLLLFFRNSLLCACALITPKERRYTDFAGLGVRLQLYITTITAYFIFAFNLF